MPLLGLEKVTFQLEEGLKAKLNDKLKGIYLSGLGNIIAGTPADKGTHRNSWFLTVGVASRYETTSKSKGVRKYTLPVTLQL